MNAISVLTCTARGQYLAQAIASIDRAGGATFEGSKTIHVDGPADHVPRFPGWEILSVTSARAGARVAMVEVMRRAAAADVETLLYFEDDVVLCRNAIRAMLEIGVPEPLGLVSYCDLRWEGRPLELTAIPGCPREYQVADGGFFGCQALALPLRTLRRFETWTPPSWLDHNNCDGTIGSISEVYGILDSLANHIGADSCIMGRTYERLRAVRRWRGEDFDADIVPRTFVLNELGTRCAMHVGVLHEDGLSCPRR
jgi:hypothetical protein